MNEQNYRHEYKYLISEANVVLLQSRIKGIMKPDVHAGEYGHYNIRSLYFDDYQNSCYYENENGTKNRSKYRIRIYNHSDQVIHLEKKTSIHGKKKKETTLLSRMDSEYLMRGCRTAFPGNQDELFQKFTINCKTAGYHPVVIVEYERIPYVDPRGNVRITFDMNISSSSALGLFFEERIPKRPVMPVGMHLLEVKYDEYLPDEIRRRLQIEELQYTAFSKYCLCRRISMK